MLRLAEQKVFRKKRHSPLTVLSLFFLLFPFQSSRPCILSQALPTLLLFLPSLLEMDSFPKCKCKYLNTYDYKFATYTYPPLLQPSRLEFLLFFPYISTFWKEYFNESDKDKFIVLLKAILLP